jgi:Zn-dependent protease
MAQKSTLFTLMGLDVTITPRVLITYVALAVVLTLIALLLGLSLIEAVIAGLIAALLHYALGLAHHIGHAIAARRTGYPMSGIHFWGILATSVYPRDELELPGSVHIQRALGGPIASGILSIVLAILAALVRPPDTLLDWLIIFALTDNVLTFTIGVLLPLRNIAGIETDMDTLLKWSGMCDSSRG